MQDSYSSIGGTVRVTYVDPGYTPNELADKTDIINDPYQAPKKLSKYHYGNSVSANLHRKSIPESFCPELGWEPKAHYQLWLLLDNCNETIVAHLLSMCETAFIALRTKDGIIIE